MSIELRLYVSRHSVRSRGAIAMLETLRGPIDEVGGTVEVVDVTERPELAEADRILATPTLVRRQPAPPRRIVGDVSDVQLLLARLDLPPDFLERP